MASILRFKLTRRSWRPALVAIVVLYGALLRFDALTLTFGPVTHPGWLKAVQQSRGETSAVRPDGFRWTRWEGRYISDPYTYIQYGRAMTSFYAAHRREPLFPAATKTWLWLLGDQDVAVSFASLTFSTLAILATFLVGAAAFNYWIGLSAAGLVAIEYDLVSIGVLGWRDDAFMCGVLFCAWGMLRWRRHPSMRNAIILGVAAGLACLVRITALSFLVPGFIALALAQALPWRTRLKSVATAAIVMMILIGPFLFNCWRAFGDPFYAINVHADIYRETEGQRIERSQTTREYLTGMLQSRPARTLDTAMLGMTTYPFNNKWVGFDRWVSGAGKWLSWLALAGLFLWLGSTEGRWLLVVVAGSLVPYALTWRLIFDWRFTQHAYPFFLLAAVFAVAEFVRAVRNARSLRTWRPERRAIALWTAAAAAIAVGVWMSARLLPVLIVREAIAAGESVSIPTDDRSAPFFGDGWEGPRTSGNVTTRVSTRPVSEMWVPLPRVQDYTMTVRVDPHPAPQSPGGALPRLRIFLNKQPIAVQELSFDPARVGGYTIRVPAAAVKRGTNRLELMTDGGTSEPRIRLWYVRVTAIAPQ